MGNGTKETERMKVEYKKVKMKSKAIGRKRHNEWKRKKLRREGIWRFLIGARIEGLDEKELAGGLWPLYHL